MASSQASSKISEKQRELLDGLLRNIGPADASALNDKAQATTRAEILNNGVGAISYQEFKDWSGTILGSYPKKIEKTRTGRFSHRGVPPKDTYGSKGAVVYVGPNVQGGTNNSAWILAWSTPGDGTDNKIYVETGFSTKYPPNHIDWDTIKVNLESSSNESHYYDEQSGTEAAAKIELKGNSPAASAVFDVTPA